MTERNLLVDIDIRALALELAVRESGTFTTSTVSRAEDFYKFLKPDSVQPPQSADAPAVDADKPKRGRPAKAAPAQEPAKAVDIFGDDEPAAEPAKKITKDELRAALVAAQTASSAEIVMALMKQYGGAETLSKIPEDKYAAVVAEVAKLVKK